MKAYTVTNLGSFDGDSVGFDINEGQECAVSASVLPGRWQAAVHSAGALKQLPTPAGLGSFAYGINDAHQVVGACRSPTGNRAMLWNPGAPAIDLHPFGSTWSEAHAIGDAGHVTGFAVLPTGSHAFVWHAATGAVNLGALDGGSISSGNDVNASGHVLGNSLEGAGHAFHWSPAAGMIRIAPPGATSSRAWAMNDHDTVAGEYSPSRLSGSRPFLWNPATGPVDLAVGGWVRSWDINNHDEIVGEMHHYPTSTAHAFHFANGVLTDLNDAISPLSGWVLTYAYAIDDAGCITGVGTFNGQRRAFLLAPVPEPIPLDALDAWRRVQRMQLVSSILAGVVDDGRGVVWPFGRPPRPVPPWSALWQRLSEGERDALLGDAIGILAGRVGDERARARVLESVAELGRRASPATPS